MVTDNDPTNPAAPPNAVEGTNVVPLTPPAAAPGPAEKVIGFVRKHPVMTVAGGIALGVAISALLPRKSGRKLLGRAVDLAEAAGAATMVFGRETSEKAQDLGREAKHKAGDLASRAEEVGDATAARLEKIGLAAVAAATALGKATAKRAGTIGHAASDTSHQIADKASDLRRRIRH